jgi:hypothetical protein
LRNYADAKAQYSLFAENGYKMTFERNIACASQTRCTSFQGIDLKTLYKIKNYYST